MLNVLRNLQEVIPKYLVEGFNVKHDDVGTVRLTLVSRSTDSEKECTADKIVRAVVRIICDPVFRKRVNAIIKYEKVKSDGAKQGEIEEP